MKNFKLMMGFFIIVAFAIIMSMTNTELYNEDQIVKFSTKYVVDVLNDQIGPNKDFYFISENDINRNDFDITVLAHISKLAFVKVKYSIPSDGDWLVLILYHNEKSNVFYLLNKEIEKAKHLSENSTKNIKIKSQLLHPEGNKSPPGY